MKTIKEMDTVGGKEVLSAIFVFRHLGRPSLWVYGVTRNSII